jgi:hypothetical protein
MPNSGGTPLRRGIGADLEDAPADDRVSPREMMWTSATADAADALRALQLQEVRWEGILEVPRQ